MYFLNYILKTWCFLNNCLICIFKTFINYIIILQTLIYLLYVNQNSQVTKSEQDWALTGAAESINQQQRCVIGKSAPGELAHRIKSQHPRAGTGLDRSSAPGCWRSAAAYRAGTSRLLIWQQWSAWRSRLQRAAAHGRTLSRPVGRRRHAAIWHCDPCTVTPRAKWIFKAVVVRLAIAQAKTRSLAYTRLAKRNWWSNADTVPSARVQEIWLRPDKKYFSPSVSTPLFALAAHVYVYTPGANAGEFIFLLIVDYVFGIFSISAQLMRVNLFLWLAWLYGASGAASTVLCWCM